MNLAFPEVKSFSELFSEATYYKTSAPQPHVWYCKDWMFTGKRKHLLCELGPYCHCHSLRELTGHVAMYVRAKYEVVAWVKENMLGGYKIYFELVTRDDSSVLVTAQYDQILGNRWLAVIDPATIPLPATR